jgi:hypothetical protein
MSELHSPFYGVWALINDDHGRDFSDRHYVFNKDGKGYWMTVESSDPFSWSVVGAADKAVMVITYSDRTEQYTPIRGLGTLTLLPASRTRREAMCFELIPTEVLTAYLKEQSLPEKDKNLILRLLDRHR